MSMSSRTRKRIERLVDMTESESMSDVIRQALALYEIAVSTEKAGGQTIVRIGGIDTRIIIDY